MIVLHAKKVSIKEVLNSSYVKEDGMNLNYLIIENERVSRVNIIGTLINVRKEENEAELDDGSGIILLKSFEQKNIFEDVKVGDLVLVIAKPREFGSRYLVPEILKKTTIDWLEIRKEEVKKRTVKEPVKEETFEEKVEFIKNDKEKLLNRIRSLDDGDGVMVLDIIKENADNEELIQELLKEGEIFQPGPGKIKVLE
ncbi:hypothetical protein HY837_00390 [archaeon]|nr:hypothetical protein [archaeon]